MKMSKEEKKNFGELKEKYQQKMKEANEFFSEADNALKAYAKIKKTTNFCESELLQEFIKYLNMVRKKYFELNKICRQDLKNPVFLKYKEFKKYIKKQIKFNNDILKKNKRDLEDARNELILIFSDVI